MSATPTCPLCQASALKILSQSEHGGVSDPYSDYVANIASYVMVERECENGHVFGSEERNPTGFYVRAKE